MQVKKGFISALLLGLLVLVSACSEPEQAKPLERLRIGMLPDVSKAALLSSYTPLFEYLSAQLGVPYELPIPQDYASLVSDFGAGN